MLSMRGGSGQICHLLRWFISGQMVIYVKAGLEKDKAALFSDYRSSQQRQEGLSCL